MRAIRLLLLVLLILLLLAGLLLALFPARLAHDLAGDRLGALRLEGVGGTIWRGHAQQASAFGEPVGTLRWQLSPTALLGRRVDADLQLDGDRYDAQGFVSATRESTRITDARVTLPAERLQPMLDVPALVPRGRVEVEIDRAELVGGFPRQLEGRAVWRDAAVDGAAAAQFGELVAEFQTAADGALIGTLSDRGGALMLDGQFRVGFTGFEAEAVLAPRDGNPQVAEALQYIGEPQGDGSSILQIRGQLLPVR